MLERRHSYRGRIFDPTVANDWLPLICRVRRMPQRPRTPHLNVVVFCSLVQVYNSLEASLAKIEMGVAGALMETVGSKNPSSVAI